jgi:hypothetical protein
VDVLEQVKAGAGGRFCLKLIVTVTGIAFGFYDNREIIARITHPKAVAISLANDVSGRRTNNALESGIAHAGTNGREFSDTIKVDAQ